jgi:hypothetical protein
MSDQMLGRVDGLLVEVDGLSLEAARDGLAVDLG